MKKLFFLSLASMVLTASISSCKKKTTDNNGNNANTIEVPIVRSDTTTLPQAIVAFPISLNFMDSSGAPGGPVVVDTFATKVDEYIQPYGFAKKDIVKVNLTSLNMILENSPGQSFNFVKDTTPISVKLFVDSVNGNNPKMIAYRTSVPRNLTQLFFDVDPTDIKDYFNAEYMKILIGFYTQEGEGLSGNSIFRVNYKFTVTANQP